ncbi:hypothetical protein AB1Y20_021406 [Prymnesium parvum]|uniref:EF-hand domain-containing protein n=1 Tax=Prymnesium parvum TaxID=97485 RepID=A0AB34JM01_PRYPA
MKAALHSCRPYIPLDATTSLHRYAFWIIAAQLAAGTCFYTYEEGWVWQDALYFCTVALLTVGYGDLAPSTDLSKMFTIVYILLGLSLIATCFGILFARLQDKMESASHAQNFLSALLAMLLCIGSGTALVMTTEGWSLLDSIYWSVVTSSSTGFGDLTIENSTTRLLATPYMLISVGCFAASLGRLGSIIMDIETDRAVRAFVARGVFHDMLQEMDGDGSGSIDMCEFLRYMLIKLGKVKDSDIQMIQDMFDKLDTDRSGTLDVHDIRAEQARLEGTPLPKLVPAKSASITQDSPSFWRWASGVSSLMQDLKKPLMS